MTYHSEYKIVPTHQVLEVMVREVWRKSYCDGQVITIYGGIIVRFYEDTFEHAFYESERGRGIKKTIFATLRAERIHWIKDALLDENAVHKQGWDSKRGKLNPKRRVTIVQGNYIVVIDHIGIATAKFITAYLVDNPTKLTKILEAPNWNPNLWK